MRPSILQTKKRRSWIVPAFFAATLFIGGIGTNLLASDLEETLKPYRKWVWLTCLAAFIAAIIAAIRDHLRADESPTPSGQSDQRKTLAIQIEDNIPKLVIAPTPTVNSLRQLPPPPRDFTGRKSELDELMRELQHGGVTISGLQGQGGVGKTTLALKLAEMLKPRYPDAQFYLDLKGVSPQPLTPSEAMAHVIRAYHPTTKLPDSEAELSGLYQSVLEGKRALLLMDNAKDREQIVSLIPPASCVLLATSRHHFTLPGMFAKNLDTMTPAESRELLLRIAPRIEDQVDELAKLCGYLPLALRLAASALAERPDIKPADYVRRLTGEQKRLELVEAALSLSYEMHDETQRKLWRALAVFPDTFDASGAAAVWEMESDAAQDKLSDLVKLSLVEWNAETSRYRLHDLACVFANSRLSQAERDDAKRQHAKHYKAVIDEAGALYEKGGEAIKRGLGLFDTEWGNIQAGQAWAVSQAESDNETVQLCIDYHDCNAYLINLRLHPRERIRWLEPALKAARQLKRPFSEGFALANLGVAHRHLGETHKAIEFLEQALVVSCEIGDHRSEGFALSNLGNAYYDLGEMQKAIGFHEQALSIRQEVGDRRIESYILGNLGIAYRNLGETRKAIEFLEQSLRIHREINDHRGEGFDLGNLGKAYADLGETRKAIEFYEQALIIRREIGDRRGEGFDLWYLSLTLDKLGEREKAIELAEASLKIREDIEDPAAEEVRKQLAEWRGQK